MGARASAGRSAPLFGGDVVLVAVAYAAVLTVVRLTLLILYGNPPLDARGLVSILGPAAAEHFVEGLVPVWLVVRGRAALLAGAAIGVLLLAGNVVAFGYEWAFGRLPGPEALYYLREIRALAPSLGTNLRLGVALVILIGAAVLLGAVVRRRRRGRALGAPAMAHAAVLTALALTAWTQLAPLPSGGTGWRRHSPFGWLLARSGAPDTIGAGDGLVATDDVRFVLRELGHDPGAAPIPEEAPLCRPGGSEGGPGNGRSAILLILESIGWDEMHTEVAGRPLMPNLLGFAARHRALPAIAAGSKSSQAMPALFSGLPPTPDALLLQQIPLPRVTGFPSQLEAAGYRTVYLHGGDLQFEQQLQFLQMVGFGEIEGLEPHAQQFTSGWGHDDGAMLARLQEWIGRERRRQPSQPYFATLFTLTTHDPYRLPPGVEPPLAIRGPGVDFWQTAAYLDRHLGAFFEWYEREEAERGTVLVVVGDHPPFHRNRDPRGLQRFDVPLVIAGAGRAASRPLDAPPRAAQHDVPAVLLGLLGLPQGRCDRGLDVLTAAPATLERRVIPAVPGEDVRELHLYGGGWHALADLRSERLRILERGAEPAVPARLVRFASVYGRLLRMLIERDALAPPPRAPAGTRLRPLDPPRVIAHRGLVGPGRPENSIASVLAAAAAGFEWVEVDLHLTADSEAVLLHDPSVERVGSPPLFVRDATLGALREAATRPVDTLPDLLLAVPPEVGLLVELKPTQDYDLAFRTSRVVGGLLRDPARERPVVVDSFSLYLAASTAAACGCEAGWDLPYRQEVTVELLDTARRAGMGWVYVEQEVLTPEVVESAHERGLRVLAYTVNDPDWLRIMGDGSPDALVTDRVEVLRAVERPDRR